MEQNNEILIGILIVIAIIVIAFVWKRHEESTAVATTAPAKAEGFAAGEHLVAVAAPAAAPHAGAPHAAAPHAADARAEIHAVSGPKTRQADSVPHRDLVEAQRQAWAAIVSPPEGVELDVPYGAMTFGEGNPAMDYQKALVDLVANPRMREQQKLWNKDIAAKSGGAMTVDDMEEAAALSTYRGQGIYAFRMNAPKQHDPLFVTDQDAHSYAAERTHFAF
jgi:hypothetical protein